MIKPFKSMVYFKIWMFCPRKTAIRTCLISVLKILSQKNRFALLSGRPDSAIEFVISAIRENQTLSSRVIMHLHKWLLLARSQRLPLFCLPKIKSGILWKKRFESNKKRDLENLKYYQEKCWRVCFVFIYGIIFLSLQINNSPVSIFSKYSSGCFCSFCCFQ